MDEMSSITPEDLAASREGFASERVNEVAKNAVTASGIRAAARASPQTRWASTSRSRRATAATRSAPAAAGCSRASTPCATA